jgi:sulfite reductase beta subunit-like hemoprotein
LTTSKTEVFCLNDNNYAYRTKHLVDEIGVQLFTKEIARRSVFKILLIIHRSSNTLLIQPTPAWSKIEKIKMIMIFMTNLFDLGMLNLPTVL